MNGKVEFGSSAWIAAVHEGVSKRLAAVDLDGVTYSSVEIFTNPPAHLDSDGSGAIGWWMRIADGQLTLGDRPVDGTFDHKVVADYGVMLPIARASFSDSPELAAEVGRTLERAQADGKFERHESDAAKPEQLAVLSDLHDEMAKITS